MKDEYRTREAAGGGSSPHSSFIIHPSSFLLATLASLSLIVLALWGWQSAGDLAADLEIRRPDIAAWAIRSGAVAAAALGQVLCLRYVAGGLYPRRVGDDLLRLSAAAICVLAGAGAVALGFLGR